LRHLRLCLRRAEVDLLADALDTLAGAKVTPVVSDLAAFERVKQKVYRAAGRKPPTG
jgi:hypothetical protein